MVHVKFIAQKLTQAFLSSINNKQCFNKETKRAIFVSLKNHYGKQEPCVISKRSAPIKRVG